MQKRPFGAVSFSVRVVVMVVPVVIVITGLVPVTPDQKHVTPLGGHRHFGADRK